MSDASGRSLPRRQVLRITATVGASAILGGGLLRAALERAGLHRVRQTRTQMGTLVTISAVHPDAEAARMMVADTFDEIERLESLLSRHRVGTPVWSLNDTGVVRAPPREVLEVVQKGLDYSVLTAGAFDITIAPLLNLYNSSFSETGIAPPREKVRRALALVGFQHVGVDDREIAFEKAGMAVTLDGIAKGYIVDRAVEVLREARCHEGAGQRRWRHGVGRGSPRKGRLEDRPSGPPRSGWKPWRRPASRRICCHLR